LRGAARARFFPVLRFILSATVITSNPRLPVPPIPPAEPPSREAPLPDLDARAPSDDKERVRVTVDMGINNRDAPDTSLGFSPGSRYLVEDAHRPLGFPGIKFHVPFP
jgi:hypothetical protein